ncbi:MAG: hypothetical protein IJM85_01980 [Clostridia bacterium]|nr:hypothetical protein [Clostridia bacterium]
MKAVKMRRKSALVLAIAALACFFAAAALSACAALKYVSGREAELKPDSILGFLNLFLPLTASLILVIHIALSGRKGLLPIAFGCVALHFGVRFMRQAANTYNSLYLFLFAVLFVAAVLGFFGSLKPRNTAFVIAASVIMLLFSLISVAEDSFCFDFLLDFHNEYYIIMLICDAAGWLALSVALLMYGIASPRPKPRSVAAPVHLVSPEFELHMLDEMLRLGKISEEEYRKLRIETIGRL